MPTFLLFPLLLLAFPLLELYILIQVGQVIGALPTIGLCILTAFLGTVLLRQQGLGTLRRARASLNRGEMPARELLEGMALAIGGVLLLVPGFLTDLAGLACLLPFTRILLLRAVLKRMRVVSGSMRRRSANDADGHRTIEGDFRRRDRD
ncbi:MAG: FxsA family protein [Nitrococcus sp.]|nr:FxsA family protein [Nitrococcus sp.]